MTKTILFDLDGTLIPFSQENFINHYFGNLVKKMAPHGLEKDALIKGVWKGTGAMVANDGARRNEEVFWDIFEGCMGEGVRELIPVFEEFYANEFDRVKEIITPTTLSKEIVDYLKGKGYHIILATNPLFPPVAVKTRLSWVGLSYEDFEYVTTYDNSSYCKPNLEYYKEILNKTGHSSTECIMVGNNAIEDMCAAKLGMRTFLVTDFLEDADGVDLTQFERGSLADLREWLKTIE